MKTEAPPLGRILRNFQKVFGGQVAVMAISFVTLALNTRALGAVGFGTFVTIEAWCQLIAMIAAFQTWQAATRYGAEAIDHRDRVAWEKYLWLGISIDITAAFLAGSVTLLSFFLLDWSYLVSTDNRFGLYFFAAIVFTSWTGTATGILRVTNSFGLNISINVCQSIFLLLAALVLKWTDEPLGTYLIVIPSIMALGNFTLLVAGIARGIQQAAALGERSRSDLFDFKAFLAFCFATSVGSTMNTIRQRGELLLVSWFLGSSAAGLYATAYRSAAVLSRFAEAGRQSVYPEFARLVTSGNSLDARRIAGKLTLMAFLVALPIFIGVVFLGDRWLVLLAGTEFSAAHPNLIWLSLGTLGYTMTFALGAYVQIAHGAGSYLKVVSIAFVFFSIGAVAGPLWLGTPGAGMGAGLFGAAMTLLLYRKIFATAPDEREAA